MKNLNGNSDELSLLYLADRSRRYFGYRCRRIAAAPVLIGRAGEGTASAPHRPADAAQRLQKHESGSGHPQQHVDVRVEGKVNAEQYVGDDVEEPNEFSQRLRVLAQHVYGDLFQRDRHLQRYRKYYKININQLTRVSICKQVVFDIKNLTLLLFQTTILCLTIPLRLINSETVVLLYYLCNHCINLLISLPMILLLMYSLCNILKRALPVKVINK